MPASRKLRDLAGERSEERDDEPDLFGGEVATDLVSAHHEHCLVKITVRPVTVAASSSRTRCCF